MKDIEWFRTHQFPEVSSTLGPIKMTVSIVNAGKQHNVVPGECHFTVDVRVTDSYTLEELLELIKANVKSDVKARSLRMRPSGISADHPLVAAANKLGISATPTFFFNGKKVEGEQTIEQIDKLLAG